MKNLKAKLQNKGGFTLIEMLIVVAIIAILIAVSIPLVSTTLERAREATDQANERAAVGAAETKYLTSLGAKADGEYKITWDGTGDTRTATFYYKVSGSSGSLEQLTSAPEAGTEGYNYGRGTAAGDVAADHADGYITVVLNNDGTVKSTTWTVKTT